MLESHVLNLFKRNTRNGVISFKMRLTLVLLPSELLQHFLGQLTQPGHSLGRGGEVSKL